jgi:hypothetical protein
LRVSLAMGSLLSLKVGLSVPAWYLSVISRVGDF